MALDAPAAHLRRRLAAPIVCLLALSLGGCGLFGGDDEKDKGKAKDKPIAAAKDFKAKASLVKAADSAAAEGEVENYVPEGEIIADSGFRPETDGFGFENYGNEEEPTNLGPAEMEGLYGEQVCISGTGEECILTPAAEEWMNNQNEGMGAGHCEGFSMAALRLYNEDLAVSDFGDAEVTSELEIVENAPLQATIAQHFVYQSLPTVLAEQVKGTPTEVLDRLIEALNAGDEAYTLGVYKADFTGGHAITPFAVEDQGDGKFAILVYDNNFPGTTRAVFLDKNTDEWNYVSGTNPDDLGQVYEGNAETGTLELDPVSPGTALQPCSFCDGDTATEDTSKGSVLAADAQFTEITLGGDPRNHPHLVFTDDDGNRTGIVDGKMLREIPDVEVVKTYATQNWEGSPEPRFRIPAGKGSEYVITVDGSELEEPTKTDVDLVGDGLVIEVEDIAMAPGQMDRMVLLEGGYGITYLTESKKEEAPSIFAGLVEDGKSYLFAASAVGVKAGSAISLAVDQEEKVVILDSQGGEGVLDGKAIYILNLTQVDEEGVISQWQNGEVELVGKKEEKVGFEYGTTPEPGKPLALIQLDKDAEVTGELELEPQEVEQP